jgi:hypothetical protein
MALAFLIGPVGLKIDRVNSGDSDVRFDSAGDLCVESGASIVLAVEGVGT